MSLVQSIDWAAIAPPVVLAATALVVLLLDLFLPPARRAAGVAVGLAGALGAIAVAGWLAADGVRRTFCLAPTRLPAAVGGEPVGRSCSYVADDYTDYFQLLVLVALVVVLLLIVASFRDDGLPPGEAVFLLLASVSGMLVLAAARDLVTLIVALEVVSLPAFVLVGMRRRDPRSAQAAVTFFVVSVVSTALSLYGMALIYGVTGSLQLDRIAVALTALRGGPHTASTTLAAAAVLLVVAGFVFKVAAVPFHAWAPDTYQGAPLPIAAMLSVASKAAGFAGLIILLVTALRPYADVWGPVIAAVSAVTMTVGNLVALRQWHVVRLLAWSTVAQGGYLLVPLGVAATSAGRSSASMHQAIQATLTYLGIYAAMNLGAFAVVAVISRRSPRRAIDDYRGLASSSPWLAVALALFLTALAGLPPGVAGLVAKVVVIRAAVHGHLTWLAVVAAVNTVIGLAYYLRLAALPFTDLTGRPSERGAPAYGAWGRRAALAAVAVTALATVMLSVYPQPLLHAAGVAAG